jgi:preprotein translocase SecE subunit
VAKPSSSNNSVTRIKATDSKKTKKSKTTDTPAKAVKATKVVKKKEVKDDSAKRYNPLAAFIGYFKGAWYELRQVRWPNRRATWSLTGAVLAFAAFFVVFILLLDALFKYIFELILQ